MLVEIIIFLLSVLVFKAVLDHILRPRNLPPGPSTLPFLGNIHQLGNTENFPVTLTKWSRKFGPVFTFFIGSQRYVVINSIEAATEALIRRGIDFAGRPPSYIAKATLRGGKDFIFRTYDATCKKHRKAAHVALRMYGEGRSDLQENICKEIDALYTRLDAFNGSPMDPHQLVMISVMNVICALVFGCRYEIDHPDIKKIEGILERDLYILSHGSLLDSIPILRFLPLTINKKIKEFNELVDEFFGRKYGEHLDTFKDGQIRDYMDALIQAAKDDEEKGDLESQGLTEDHIVLAVFDMFTAGTETLASTLRWLLLYMAAYPEVQVKVHEELDRVVGRDRLPDFQDRDKLVYFQAVIEEVHRVVTIAPLGLPHYTMADTSVNGYSIPKDTAVFINLFAIHHDPDKWENPDEFNPSRFIDQDNKLKSSAHLSFLPFSAGRRVCLGEALARMELVLIFSRLMHRYRVESPPGAAPPDLEGIFALTSVPKYNEICFIARE